MYSNRNFLLLNVDCGIIVGLVWALATVLPQIMKPFGISEGLSGWLGFSNLMVGTLFAPLVGWFVDRTKQFKWVCVALHGCLVLSLSGTLLMLRFLGDASPDEEGSSDASPAVKVWLLLFWSISGMFQNSLLPVFFEFCVELTFPAAESTTAPMLAWNASWMSLVMVAVFGVILGDGPVASSQAALNVLGLTIGLCVLATIALLIIRPELRRVASELNSSRLDG